MRSPQELIPGKFYRLGHSTTIWGPVFQMLGSITRGQPFMYIGPRKGDFAGSKGTLYVQVLYGDISGYISLGPLSCPHLLCLVSDHELDTW